MTFKTYRCFWARFKQPKNQFFILLHQEALISTPIAVFWLPEPVNRLDTLDIAFFCFETVGGLLYIWITPAFQPISESPLNWNSSYHLHKNVKMLSWKSTPWLLIKISTSSLWIGRWKSMFEILLLGTRNRISSLQQFPFLMERKLCGVKLKVMDEDRQAKSGISRKNLLFALKSSLHVL